MNVVDGGVLSHRTQRIAASCAAVAGLLFLLLPYNTPANLSLSGGEKLTADAGLQVHCEPPLLDALQHGPWHWFRFSAGGRGAVDPERASGGWCAPTVLWRASLGLLLLAGGVVILVRTPGPAAAGGPDPHA